MEKIKKLIDKSAFGRFFLYFAILDILYQLFFHFVSEGLGLLGFIFSIKQIQLLAVLFPDLYTKVGCDFQANCQTLSTNSFFAFLIEQAYIVFTFAASLYILYIFLKLILVIVSKKREKYKINKKEQVFFLLCLVIIFINFVVME